MRLVVKNDKTRALEEVEGSDGRMNVSSRSDGRSYYVSRDNGLAFSMVFSHTDTESGEWVCYLKNTSTDGKDLVIDSIGINAEVFSRCHLHFVTGTAAGGNAVSMVNLNKNSNNDAPATGHEGGAAASGITGLTDAGRVDCLGVRAAGHEEFRLADRVRLGQGDALAIQVVTVASASDTFGVIFGFFE